LAEGDMGVGDGGFGAAIAVAGRAGAGAGAFGADGEGAVLDAGQRSAPGTDGDHVDHRQRQRPIADGAVLGQADLATLDEADIGGGAADVIGDDVLDAAGRSRRAGADHAGRGAGERRERRGDADLGSPGHAAIGLHQHQRRSGALVVETLFEVLHIGGDPGHHGCVEHGGQAALVFAHHGQHIARHRDGETGQFIAQDLGDPPLMGRIGIGVDQADGDGLHIHAADFFGRGADRRVIEGFEHCAAGGNALIHLDDPARGNRGYRLDPGIKVCLARNVLAADGQHVAEAARGDERRAGALALEDHVGGNGRPVQHLIEIGGRRPGLLQGEPDAVEEGFRWVGGDGRGLGAPGASGSVDQRDVGKGATDVHGNSQVLWVSMAMSGELIDIGIAVEGFGGRTVGAQLCRCLGVELIVGNHDAVEGSRRLGGDEAAADVFQHAFGGAIIGVAHAAAAAGADAQNVALLEGSAVRERRNLALFRRAGIDDDGAAAAGHAPA
jgi:hypothetical protein